MLDLDVDRLPRHGMATRVDELKIYVQGSGQYQPFDDWIASVAKPSPLAMEGMRLSQGKCTFELRHGKRYRIEDPARGVRMFQCIIDGRTPLVAFVDERGSRRPWITVRNLFTIEEMVHMHEMCD